MKPAFLTMICVFTMLACFSQTKQRITVCDARTHEGISYAAVVFYQAKVLNGGVYTDSTGIVILSVPEQTDQLVITCVGYHSRNLFLGEFLADTISLEPVNILIPEITVYPKNKMNRMIEMGYAKNSSWRAYGDYKNNVLAVFVENTAQRDMLITKLLYKIRQETRQKTIFRVHLYAAGTDRKTPGRELITSNSVFYVNGNHNSHAVSYDVSALKIVMPADGMFVGLEWIGFNDSHVDSTPHSKNAFVGVLLTHWQNEHLSLRKNLFKNGRWEELRSGIENGNKVQNLAFGVKVMNF